MKTMVLTSSAAALLLAASATCAQESADQHAGHSPPNATISTDSPATGRSTQATGPHAMSRMQENLKNMQELMARIHSSKSPAERQQLLLQHSTAMQAHMGMMRGMVNAQGAPAKGAGMMNHDMMDHQAMQSRMDMMQMMMEQMLQHQEAQQGVKPAM